MKRSCQTLQKLGSVAFILIACMSCDIQSAAPTWNAYRPPDWRRYRTPDSAVPTGPIDPSNQYRPQREDRFTFRDLKIESDDSLARRLLGQAGRRIAYIDRHRERWRLYQEDGDGAESVDLYTHPTALGSQYGLCGVEKYAVEFDDEGGIESVTVSKHYGVEGPIFQKEGFDWDRYRNVMCASVPAAHARSYFPSTDALRARDAARLLIALFDLAAAPEALPFRLRCRTWDGRACGQPVRAFLGDFRLGDIDEFTLENCQLTTTADHSVCFTVMTGEHRLGPFPKYITVKGSTYMNNIRLDSVDVLESETMN